MAHEIGAEAGGSALSTANTGTRRIVLGPDAAEAGRRSHAAGITVHDRTGAERGGFGTMEGGAVTFAMDAPVGVGAAMR
jgi:hypothetical protein